MSGLMKGLLLFAELLVFRGTKRGGSSGGLWAAFTTAPTSPAGDREGDTARCLDGDGEGEGDGDLEGDGDGDGDRDGDGERLRGGAT